MIVGCFTLHLYCDAPEHVRPRDVTQEASYRWDAQHPGEFTGERRRDAYALARGVGWTIIPKSDKAICPIHSGKRPLYAEKANEKQQK